MSQDRGSQGSVRGSFRAGTLLLLLLSLAGSVLAAAASWNSSPTDDEPTYIGQGARILLLGDFQAPVLLWQPPLSLYVTSALLPLAGLQADALTSPVRDQESLTALGDRLIFDSGVSSETVLRLSRIPVALVTGVLVFLAGLLARRLAGGRAMVAAALLIGISPAFYAHGGLATTDLVATTAMFSASLAVMCVLSPRTGDSPSLRRLALVGFCLGLAILSKLTALAIVPVLLVFLSIALRRSRLLLRGIAWRLAFAVGVAALTAWAGFGFSVGPLLRPDSQGDLARRLGTRVPLPRSWVDTFAKKMPIPAPRYFQSIIFQGAKQHDRLYFRYFGQERKVGWWSYFPVLLLGKSTLASLLLLTLSGVILLRRRPACDEWLLFLLFAVPFGAAVLSRHNLGLRHVLPALPPLLVLGAVAWARKVEHGPSRLPLAAGVALLLAHALEGLSAFHSPVAWWNVAAGGTAEGWRIAHQANADWGQGLWELRDVVRAEDLSPVWLVPHGPEAAIRHLDEPRLRLLPADSPVPSAGWLAISTSASYPAGRPASDLRAPDRFLAGCYLLYRLPIEAATPLYLR